MTSISLSGEDQTEAAGAQLANAMRPFTRPVLLGLSGPLGAGKTTLVRGLLRALGIDGRVTSPSYTLIESYETEAGPVHHLDLYRLADAAELEHLGLTDLLAEPALLLIEWPERAPALATLCDHLLELEYDDDGRRLVIRDDPRLAGAFCGGSRADR